MNGSDNSVRCGIVLAAGEGERLRPLVQRLRGDALPKQYVNLIGTRSMLEHTLCRAERVIASERLMTVISRDHLNHAEVRRQLSDRPSGTVVIQPENKETGPGILLPLMHLYKRYPNAVVAVFPSDHFIVEEELFMAHVELALRMVERYPAYLVLLGIAPQGPEQDYGYILPGTRIEQLAPLNVHEVARFVEKPGFHVARRLVRGGGLWNTMVMAFRVQTLLEVVRAAVPQLSYHFGRIQQAIGTQKEAAVVERAYRQIEAVNFSRGLLEPLAELRASRLAILPVRGVYWSDWGSERRILSALGAGARLEGHPRIANNGPLVVPDERRRSAVDSR